MANGDPSLRDLVYCLKNGKTSHLVLFIGSVISNGWPTCCPLVPDTRKLVVEAVARRAADPPLEAYFARLSAAGSSTAGVAALERNLGSLPFESFMSCLAEVNETAAASVIRAMSCPRFGHDMANANHCAIARIAHAVLLEKRCGRVTIVTTNYDLGFERAFAECVAPLTLFTGSLVRCARHLTTTDGRIQLIKLHGSIDAPLGHVHSPVYTFSQLAQTARPGHFDSFTQLLSNADAVLFLGYGANDPDIVPAINRPRGIGILTVFNQGLPNRNVSALAARCGFGHHPCNLFVGDSANPLVLLCAELGLALPNIPAETVGHLATAEGVASAAEIMGPEDARLFAGQLTSASCAGDDAAILRPYAIGARSCSRRQMHVRLYLKSLGHSTQWRKLLTDAQKLFTVSEPSIRVSAYTSAGFHCACNGHPWKGGYFLARASWEAQFADGETDEAFELAEARLHFSLGTLATVMVWIKRQKSFRRVAEVMGQFLGIRLAWLAERLAEKAERECQWAQQAAFMEWASHGYILAQNWATAEALAETVERRFREIGSHNGQVLAGRSRGWALLGQGKIVDARKSFARAAELAADANDLSLYQKLLANLIRSLVYEHNWKMSRLTQVADAANVKTTSADIIQNAVKDSSELTEGDAIQLLGALRYSNQESWPAVRDRLCEYADCRLFPMFIHTSLQQQM